MDAVSFVTLPWMSLLGWRSVTASPCRRLTSIMTSIPGTDGRFLFAKNLSLEPINSSCYAAGGECSSFSLGVIVITIQILSISSCASK